MKQLIFTLLFSLVLASCSDNDGPGAEVFSQVSEITNGSSETREIVYDAYGRVSRYTATYPGETVECVYSYPSEDLVKIYTRDVVERGWDDKDLVREYEDELHLADGYAVSCDGIFSQSCEGYTVQKKYRHEFGYTADIRLNVVKCTEWNKNGDAWAYDRPWTWENYYIWQDGNLTRVEDCFGKSTPVYTIEYSYSATAGVLNVVPLHFGRHQYYPLQLKGILGTQPKNLITGIVRSERGSVYAQEEYRYELSKDKITSFTETRNGTTDSYMVNWVE